MSKYTVSFSLETTREESDLVTVIHDVNECLDLINTGRWTNEYFVDNVLVQPDSQSNRDKWPIRQGTWFDN